MKDFAASTKRNLCLSTFQRTSVEIASVRVQSLSASANPAESVRNSRHTPVESNKIVDLQGAPAITVHVEVRSSLGFFDAVGLSLVTESRKEFWDPIELPSEEVNHRCLVGQL